MSSSMAAFTLVANSRAEALSAPKDEENFMMWVYASVYVCSRLFKGGLAFKRQAR